MADTGGRVVKDDARLFADRTSAILDELRSIRNALYIRRLVHFGDRFRNSDPDMSYVKATEQMVAMAMTAGKVMDVRGIVDVRPDIRPVFNSKSRLEWEVCLSIGTGKRRRQQLLDAYFNNEGHDFVLVSGENGLYNRVTVSFDTDLSLLYGRFLEMCPDLPAPDVRWNFIVDEGDVNAYAPPPMGLTNAWDILERDEKAWKKSTKVQAQTGTD